MREGVGRPAEDQTLDRSDLLLRRGDDGGCRRIGDEVGGHIFDLGGGTEDLPLAALTARRTAATDRPL
jgi:hypothetical protein